MHRWPSTSPPVERPFHRSTAWRLPHCRALKCSPLVYESVHRGEIEERIGQWIRNAPSTRPGRTTQRNCSASTSFETDGFARDPSDRASTSRRSVPTSSHAEQEPRLALQRILDAASQSQHLRPQIELAAQEIGAALEATRSAWTASSRRLSEQETKLDALGRTPIPPLPGPQSMLQTLTSGVPSQPWRNGGAKCVQPARAASGR
jgi:hypothetical protein